MKISLKQKLIINLVAVGMLAVLMVGWVLFSLVGVGISEKPFKVTADFAASGGVFTNQEVTYRGVLVGQVSDMQLNDDGVTITMVIEPEWVDRIPANVLANVRSKSAVGEQFVNLTPDESSEEMLADGDEIPRERTSLPVDFQELLKSLDNVLADVPPDQTARLIENLAGGLGGREDEIATILESLGTLSEGFADVAEEQKSLLDNATVAGSEFLRTKDAFAAAIRAADDVFAGLGDEPEETRNFLAQNDRLAREGLELLNRSGDSLREGIAALADFTSFQLDEKESVIQSLEYTPLFLRAIEEASIPWTAPDGRTFYRIRVGLVYADQREEFWPCKYSVPDDYERLPHLREDRGVHTGGDCVKKAASSKLTESLMASLEAYAAEYGQRLNTVSLDLGASVPVADTGVVLSWPLVGSITSYFGPRDGSSHTGVDIDGHEGDAVSAAAPGRVVTSGYHPGGYGNVVVIDHGGGVATLYAHLSAIDVKAGQMLQGGDQLGAVGCTGSCTGDHLHFEVRINEQPVDPLFYLPGASLFAGHVDHSQHDNIGGS